MAALATSLARRRHLSHRLAHLWPGAGVSEAGESRAWIEKATAAARRAFASPSSTATAASLPPPGVAYAFDIDGVLLRGKTPIPGAADALRRLLLPGTATPAAPFVFITNGGGVTEADKAADVAALLGLPPAAVPPAAMILAHTPFVGLATADEPVLVIGGKQSLDVARGYGFTAAASPAQVAAAAPRSQLPLRPPHCPSVVGHLPTCPRTGAPAGSPSWPFTAVLVLHDPECWHTDIQITLDVLGQGAFAAALRAVARATGQAGLLAGEVIYGKPTPWPYRLAEKELVAQAARLASSAASPLPPPLASAWRKAGIQAVVAVGDNPAADMAGAAAAGEPWRGLLVRTGVHTGEENCPVHPGTAVVEDVGAAVEWGWRLGRDKAAEWGTET